MDILKNINVLLAKLTEKQYAPYKELYESMKEEYDKRYDHIFGIGNNRLYLDDNVEIKAVDYSADLFSVDFVRFVTFLAILTKSHFEDLYLDILYNRIYSKDGREYKLTKFMQLLTEQKLRNVTKEEYDYILNEYDVKKIISYYISNLPPKSILNNDGKIKLIVVISRNPYDIAGMSTDRRWTSCMRLPDDGPSIHPGGAYHQHLIHDIRLGTLVAYLIEPADKNIDKPYARIAIKPHHNIEKKSVYLFSEDRVYHDNSLGTDTYEKFKSTVDKFLSEVQDESEGIFMLPDQLYNDSNSRVKTQGNLIKHIDFDYMFDIEDGKKILKNFPLLSNYTFEFDIYIFNNKKYNQSYENNLVTVVEDEIVFFHNITNDDVFFHNITNDEKIYNVYSIYITKAKEPIEKHIVRIDISIGVVPELIKIEYNKVIVKRPKIYIEKLCVKDNLKNDEDFIDTIFNFVEYIYYFSKFRVK